MMTQSPWCWNGESPDRAITVVAVEGSIGDWAAYFETPTCMGMVKEYGDKLPRKTAEAIFPDWAKEKSWRE
jgi:hypothetical protein